MLRAKYATPFRRPLVDGATAELGEKIDAAEKQVEAGKQEEKARKAKLRKLRDFDGDVADLVENPTPRRVESAERLARLLAEDESGTEALLGAEPGQDRRCADDSLGERATTQDLLP